jgi:hypothetical protein
MNKFKLAIIVIFAYGCSSKSGIYGTYKHSTKVGSEIIEINKDSIFYLKSSIPLMEYESKGKWSVIDNKIYFKSFDEYKNDYVLVKEIEENNNTSSITFIDENNNSIPYVALNINNKWFDADFYGEIKNIDIKKGDLIKIKSILLGKDFEYVIKNNYKSFKVVFKIYSKKNNLIYINEFTPKGKSIIIRNVRFKKIK